MISAHVRDIRMRPRQLIVVVLTLLYAFVYTHADTSIVLRDVTRETGITFKHTDGSSGQRYIVESVSAGLALFDYDGDGDEDIYFLNGAALKGTKYDTPPKNVLYRNDGRFKFKDVTDEAGVGETGFGLGVAAGDYDNDGDLDLYVNNYGPNVLYRNNGDGTFTDVTKQAGVANGHKVGAAVFFLDMDKDGDLDLFVANYLKFTYQNHLMRTSKGIPKYAGPMDFPPMPNDLFRNNGDGTFTNFSKESGVAEHKGWGMGGVCADYDNDGDTDVYIANDVAANFLFQNDGTGKFEEVGLLAGLAYDIQGQEHGSMGIDCGDYDNDGRLDFYQTCYSMELATLYRNLGDRMFEDVTMVTGAGAGTLPHVTWGNSFVDFDNDGDRDIFIACGHLQDNVELYNDAATTLSRNIILMNTGNGKYVDISDQGGDGMKVKLRSRGAAFDDLDNDGDIDVVILNSRREPTILRNDSLSKGHWIQVRLRGTKSNRNGVGAHVKVVAGDLTLLDEVHSGRGYQSHYGMRLHFGLGNREKIDRIEVR
ncbi:MAG: CRTAC1 family protein, partial [Planctomycetota bacterium]